MALEPPKKPPPNSHELKTNRNPVYRTWEAMLERCRRPQYRKRGISVFPPWLVFEIFSQHLLSTIGPVPVGLRGHRRTLDRIDNDRGYEPGNIRWATPKEQQRNTSHNTVITVAGVSRCISEWAEVSDLTSNVICARRRHGWPDDLAVTLPVGTRISKSGRSAKPIAVGNKSHTIAQWAEVSGLSEATIYSRLWQGWPEHLAVTTPARRKRRDRAVPEIEMSPPGNSQAR